jgi:HK97 family phage portal protein
MSLRRFLLGHGDLQKRDVAPLEGTNISLFNTIIPAWWNENGLTSASSWVPGDGYLAERVWVANRCIQLNSQQIASMPLRFESPQAPSATEPEWLSAPDTNMFPNGIADAIFAHVAQLYGWGYSCSYITQFYNDGFPRNWTVLPSANLSIEWDNGARKYKLGEKLLDPRRVVQIDRNPGTAAHGCSALRAYAQQAWGLLAAGNQSMTVNQGGIPQAVIKSARHRTKAQAEAIQTKWMEATSRRNGAPPVLDPELDFQTLSFNPADLALLDTQEFNAKALATAFGVPSVLINMALQGGMTYQNPAALGEMWWRFELRTVAKRVADAFTAQMLPRGQWVWFDARDTFLPLDEMSDEDDPQASTAAKASPTQQSNPPVLTVAGGA